MKRKLEFVQFFPRDRLRLGRRLKWLINIRWLAAACLALALVLVRFVLSIDIPLPHLYTANACLIVYNSLFLLYLRRLDATEEEALWFRKVLYLLNIQISLDFILLIVLVHFSGGLENPFVFFFIFHVVIASVLLSRKAAYLQTSLAVILFGIIIGGENLGLIKHYHPAGFLPQEVCFLDFRHFLGSYFVFLLTLYLTVYVSTTIIRMLREREMELKRANDRLQEQDRIKSEYVLRVTHDIKGSLGTIKGCLGVVLDGLTGEISEKTRDMVGRGERRSAALLDFVRSLNELSDMRAAREIEKEPVDLSGLLKRVQEEMAVSIESGGRDFEVSDRMKGRKITANRVLIEELFRHLISNAIGYSPHGGKISIDSGVSAGEKAVRVTVSDNGIGMSREDLPRIFEDFYRGKNAAEMVPDGTGLGLSIVKQIVDMHGGTISVSSRTGRGSRFTIELPLA